MTFPFCYRTKIKSHLSPGEIIAILDKYTLTSKGQSYHDQRATVIARQEYERSRKNYLYHAVIDDNSRFTLRRYTGSGKDANSFNPFCFGAIHQLPGESEISLVFRPHLVVFIFLYIAMAMVVESFFAIMISVLAKGNYGDAVMMLLAHGVIFGFFWLLHRYAFKREADRTLVFLKMFGVAG
jgi:hypothetical protein